MPPGQHTGQEEEDQEQQQDDDDNEKHEKAERGSHAEEYTEAKLSNMKTNLIEK